MAQVIWNSDIDVYNKDVMPINIAENIVKYLPIQDLLSFSQVSKNCHLAVNDPKLWVSMLKGMRVWQESKQLTKQDIKSNKFGNYLNDPLTCMDYIYRSNKNAKFQVIKIYKCLHEFYNDLLIQQNYNRLKIFKRFQTPQDQVKILKNLRKFNKIDYIESTRIIANEKIMQLFELLENALLRELEIHFDLEDYIKTKQFVNILIDLNNNNNNNQQILIDFFLQKSIFDENIELFNLENYDEMKYFKINEKRGEEEEKIDSIEKLINNDGIDELIINIAKVFNQQSHIIDLIFPQSIPMMYKVSEELISNQLSELLMLLIESLKKFGLYSELVPMIYEKLTMNLFIEKLNPSKNVGESYHQLIIELTDMLFESFTAEYMREEVGSFKNNTKRKLLDWEQLISKREQETSQKILDRVKIETKNDFLTSFKNVFTINSSKNKQPIDNSKHSHDDNSQLQEEVEAYSEIQAKAKILSENIKSLDKIFNPELTVEILNDCRISIHRLLKFQNFSIASVRQDIFQSIQNCFVELIELINLDHLLPGFDRALTYLQTYNPKSSTYTKSHNETFDQPLILFFNLINMADIIIQMIDIFYKQEILITQQNENSILNPSLQNKKKLEAIVDKYVADGLNIGIEILIDQVETIYQQNLSDKDYYPDQQEKQQQQQQQTESEQYSQAIPIPTPSKPNTLSNFGPTEAAIKATEILEQNMNLLVDSADKSIVDVFQQEIAERFFQIIVKSLKLQTISVMGATRLISDLNLYFKFINNNVKSNKRLILPLYQALIKIGNIYLISGDDSKSIGKLVSDLSKFNGIFSQEEIYEFVQRRQDWSIIKKHVEKVMYGFGFGDCTIS